MVSPLVLRWVPEGNGIEVHDEASVSVVRTAVREAAAVAGLGRVDAEAITAAASELVHNQLRHARRGRVLVAKIEREGVGGVEVTAADEGDGILDPTAALDGRSGVGLGVGLAAAYRLSDELDFDVRRDEGTCVVARKFAGPVSRFEVAILGRPLPGETTSGDDAAWVRTAGGVDVLVADGLGHGPPARSASERLAAVLRGDAPRVGPASILQGADALLEGTRGAVASVVAYGPDGIVHYGVGNVGTQLYAGNAVHRFLPEAGVLGRRDRRRRGVEERRPVSQPATLAMFTDGLVSRTDLSAEPALLRRPAIVIAQALLERYARSTDDALVLVVRPRG